MRTLSIPYSTFEKRRQEGSVQPFVYYKMEDCVAWSPDGDGFFWYDTFDEAKEQHA